MSLFCKSLTSSLSIPSIFINGPSSTLKAHCQSPVNFGFNCIVNVNSRSSAFGTQVQSVSRNLHLCFLLHDLHVCYTLHMTSPNSLPINIKEESAAHHHPKVLNLLL